MKRIVKDESKGFFARLFSSREMDVPLSTALRKESRFEWLHKIFKVFEFDNLGDKTDSFTFDTAVADATHKSGKYKLSWRVDFSFRNIMGLNQSGVLPKYFYFHDIKVTLLNKLNVNDIAYVTVSLMLRDQIVNFTFDSESELSVTKELDISKHYEINVAKSFILVEVRLFHEDKIASRMLDNYNTYVASEKSCNIELCAGDKKFPAHREILTAHSKYFESRFTDDWLEKKQVKIEIEGVEPKILKFVLDHIYFAEIDCEDVVDWLKIIVAADYFQINSLYKVSEDYISGKVDAENFADVFTNADLVSSKKLKEECVKFIAENKAAVVNSKGYKNLVKTREDLATELLTHVMLGCSLFVEKGDE